jgi:ribonuclease VapC
MFIDASALVAILTCEPGHEKLSAQIEDARQCMTSAIAIWETAVRLTSKALVSVDEAKAIIRDFIAEARIEIVSIGRVESDLALDAFARYGKRRHPADLNMGDCFAYACAKAAQMPLLYVGNDFAQTDVNLGFE